MKEECFSQREKDFILTWLEKHCLGRKNAKFREQILPFISLHMSDRKFRRIVADLIKEGHIYSSASFGYFFMPLVNPTDLDIEAAKHAILERKSKALSTLESCDKNMKKVKGLRQGQEVFI